MSPLDFTYASKDGQAAITVFVPGQNPKILDSDNVHFQAVHEALIGGNPKGLSDQDIVAFCDVEKGYAKRFERVSERVAFANRRLYFDGDVIDGSLAKQIIAVQEQDGSARALVAFLEKVMTNPSERSRNELYTWVEAQGLTIVDSEDETCGDIIGYKGCTKGTDGVLRSMHYGGCRAIVNGEVVEDAVPYPIGAIVEMPRSEVDPTPGVPCSVGLHVGSYNYAKGYARGSNVLEVRVNPRDVVEVPSGADKMRVCRLRVIQPVERKYERVTVKSDPAPVPPPVALDKPHIPTSEEWAEAKARAKRRRQNFHKWVTTVAGWKFSSAKSADPEDPKSYRVPPVKTES